MIKRYVIYSLKNVDLYVCPVSFIISRVSDELIL